MDPIVELVESFLGFHLYFNPVTATILGADGYETRLPDNSPGGIEARGSAYREWLTRVRAVDVRTTSLDLEMDLRVAERAIRLALAEVEELEPWARNPLFTVRLLREALDPLVHSGTRSDEERLLALTARQRQLPTLLSEARRTLEEAPALLTQQAIGELEGTLTWLRRDLPSRFAGAPESDPKWGFERSNAASIEEVEAFLTFLREELLPRSGEPLVLGSAVVDRLVAASGAAPSGTALLEEVEAEVVRLRRWVDAEAGRLGGNTPAATLLERLDAVRLPGDSVLPVARNFLGEIRTFVDGRRVLPLPGTDPAVRPVPLTRPAPAVELVGAERLASGGDAPALYLDPLGAGRPITREVVEAGVMREGVPGRLVLHSAASWVGRPIRLALPAPEEEDGWGLHAAALALDQGFRGGDPLLRIAQLRDRLERVTRLRAGLHFHRGEWSLEDAVRETRSTTGLSEEAARRLVERNIHNPLEGLGGVHALRYEALRDDLLDRPLQMGGPLTLDTALTVILAAGLSPDLARLLLLPEL